MVSIPIPAYAAPPTPKVDLTVSFDLTQSSLSGHADIQLPPSEESTTVYLGNLTVNAIQLGAASLEPAPSLDIPASQATQHLSIDYALQLDAKDHAGLIGKNGIALTNLWHPQPERDCLYKLTATIPNTFSAISEAEQITSQVIGPEKKVSFDFPYPIAGLNFVAGPYVVEKESFGNGKILASYFFAEDQELAASYRKKTRAYLERYEKLIGPYPYQRFSIVENRLPTGYAMPTFTLLGQAVVRLPFITATSLGHEVLHSWFGNSVFIKTEEGNWCEGLTTYLADQAYAVDKDKDGLFRKEQLIKYHNYVPEDNTIALKDFNGGVSHLAPMGKELRAVGYNKCSMVFHMLRQKIGEKDFTKGLRIFYQKNKYRRGGWSDLEQAFEEASGLNLDLFFSQWLKSTDLAQISLQKMTLSEEKGQSILAFTLVQEQKQPYQLQVPLLFDLGKTTRRELVQAEAKETAVSLSFAEPPLSMVVDPDYDLMRTLEPEELPPTWAGFIGAKEKICVLPEDEQSATYAPLLSYFEDLGCKTMTQDEATDVTLADKTVVFLGTESAIVRSLFATPSHAEEGLTVDIRMNPLARDQVAVLISAQNEEQSRQALRKLRHYGKYSFLHFISGRIQEKRITETESGHIFTIDAPPSGMALPQSLTFGEIMERLQDSKVIYVGETHTRVEDHQLQLRVIRDQFKKNPELAIGMEMFPREAQKALDQYVAKEIDEWEFLKKSHYFKVWGFDYRLYRGIIDFARHNNIPVIGLNLKKDIVSKVFKNGGIAGLAKNELAKIPEERDLDVPGYKQRITRVFSMHGKKTMGSGPLNNFFQAQALWDETMAESIVSYLKKHPQKRMVIVAGQGHTAKDTAIPPRVTRRMQLKQTVLVNSQPQGVDEEEADYVLFSRPADLPPKPLLGVMLMDSKDGVLVAGLSDKGAAGKAGIKKKDVIESIDDEPVATIEDLKIVMYYRKHGDKVVLRIKRGEEEHTYSVTI